MVKRWHAVLHGLALLVAVAGLVGFLEPVKAALFAILVSGVAEITEE